MFSLRLTQSAFLLSLSLLLSFSFSRLPSFLLPQNKTKKKQAKKTKEWLEMRVEMTAPGRTSFKRKKNLKTGNAVLQLYCSTCPGEKKVNFPSRHLITWSWSGGSVTMVVVMTKNGVRKRCCSHCCNSVLILPSQSFSFLARVELGWIFPTLTFGAGFDRGRQSWQLQKQHLIQSLQPASPCQKAPYLFKVTTSTRA